MIYIDTRDSKMPQNHKDPNRQAIAQLLRFRQELRIYFQQRPDAMMDLVDALCSNTEAQSVAELSLSPCFHYQYPSVYDGIDQFLTVSTPERAAEPRRRKEMELMGQSIPYLPLPHERKFWRFGLDVTPVPRPCAWTLADRTCIYHANPVLSNPPVTIGHQYAALVYFPEKGVPASPPWVVPLKSAV